MIRLVSELSWAMRRAGLVVSPPKVADLARAFVALPEWSLDDLRLASRAVLVESRDDVATFEGVWARFFDPAALHAGDARGRLAREGVDVEALVALLRSLGEAGSRGALTLLGLLEGPYVTEKMLEREGRAVLREATGASQEAYWHAELRRRFGLAGAEADLALVVEAMRGAWGEARARATEALLARELSLANDELRAHLRGMVERPLAVRNAQNVPFATLTEDEAREAEAAMLELSRLLRGAARTRERRWTRGRLDGRRTASLAMATFGVPVRLARRTRRRERPRLFVIADLSDSVRPATRLFLGVAQALSSLFRETRVFVFVRDLAECTRELASPEGLARVLSGELVSLADLSSYERALSTFERAHLRDLDRRATVLILGDGRTNQGGAGLGSLAKLRAAAREVVFLSSDPREAWGRGDSAMPKIAKAVSRVMVASTVAELRAAVREVVTRG